MESIDRTSDVLKALKLAQSTATEKDLVVNILDCICTEINSLKTIQASSDHTTQDLISREQVIQKMNYFINSIRQDRTDEEQIAISEH